MQMCLRVALFCSCQNKKFKVLNRIFYAILWWHCGILSCLQLCLWWNYRLHLRAMQFNVFFFSSFHFFSICVGIFDVCSDPLFFQFEICKGFLVGSILVMLFLCTHLSDRIDVSGCVCISVCKKSSINTENGNSTEQWANQVPWLYLQDIFCIPQQLNR